MTEAGIGALRGRVVSPRRWLRAVAVIGATAMLLASSCTWQLSLFITGGLDGDAAVERAMGPMQFISETWRLYGVAARNDGIANVDNIDDAALSAAGYLCWRGKDLATPRGWITALRAYNNSVIYARAVRDWATAYAAGHPL